MTANIIPVVAASLFLATDWMIRIILPLAAVLSSCRPVVLSPALPCLACRSADRASLFFPFSLAATDCGWITAAVALYLWLYALACHLLSIRRLTSLSNTFQLSLSACRLHTHIRQDQRRTSRLMLNYSLLLLVLVAVY
jgi:hypothetical protein